MELYLLNTFVAVAKKGSVRKAAESLYMSSPTASGHIKALEDELQLPLFSRNPKGMVLTAEGRILLDQAIQTINSAKRLQDQACELRGKIFGEVLVGLNAPSRLLKASELAKEVGKNPNIDVMFEPSSTGKIIEGLSSGTLDAGFLFANPSAEDIEVIRLSSFELCVAVPTVFQDKIEPSNWKKLARLPWVCSDGYCPFQSIASSMFEQQGLSLKNTVFTNDEYTKLDFVRQGFGAALLLKEECLEYARNDELIIWETDPVKVELFFAFATNRQHDPIIGALKQAVKTVWHLKR